MLELTGIASLLRGASILYWVLAIGALGLALWKGKRWWGKAIAAAAVIAVFGYLPLTSWVAARQREAYARQAWGYFKKLCDEKAGQKIYKTFNDVKSVLIVKPLPPATEKDLFDQFWYGDPYSDSTPWDKRAEHAAGKLVYPDAPIGIQEKGRGFEFVELRNASGNEKKLIKIYYEPALRDYKTEAIERSVSRFGLAWEDISTPEDRKYWIAGSRLRVVDLKDESVVAERIGYYIEAGFGSQAGQRRPWLTSKGRDTTCPYSHDWADRWFVLKALSPEEKQHGK